MKFSQIFHHINKSCPTKNGVVIAFYFTFS